MTFELIYNEGEVIDLGNQQLKNRKPIGSAVDKDLYTALKNYSEETKIPISKLLDKAIELLLESARK